MMKSTIIFFAAFQKPLNFLVLSYSDNWKHFEYLGHIFGHIFDNFRKKTGIFLIKFYFVSFFIN